MFVVACAAPISVVVADCCLLTASPMVGGLQRAEYMASLPEVWAAGVGLGERLVAAVKAATAGEPQSMTGGKGRRHLKIAPGALASSEPPRSADGGLSR